MQIDLSIFQGAYGFAVAGAEFTPRHPKAILTCMLRKILYRLYVDNIVNQRFWFSPDHGTNQRRNKGMNDMYSINPWLVLYVGRLLFIFYS